MNERGMTGKALQTACSQVSNRGANRNSSEDPARTRHRKEIRDKRDA